MSKTAYSRGYVTSSQGIYSLAVALLSLVVIVTTYSCRGSGQGGTATTNRNGSTDQPRMNRAPAAAGDNL